MVLSQKLGVVILSAVKLVLFKAKVLICAVERGEQDAFIPTGVSELRAGDRVSIVARPVEALRFFRQIGIPRTKVRQTMIIGGLIQERKTDYLDSIPIINQIPIIKRLFGNTNANVERTELLVLITGYIINEKSPVEEMIKRYNDSLRSLNSFNKDIKERGKSSNRNRRMLNNPEFWK